jgi:cellobiose-specific phosphotransferase system component IIC
VLGELPARQARGQRLELALTISLSGLGGLAVGIALAVAVVPAFARAAAPGSGVLPSVALHLDVVGGLGLLAAFVAALVAVVVVHGVRVGRSAATPREAS